MLVGTKEKEQFLNENTCHFEMDFRLVDTNLPLFCFRLTRVKHMPKLERAI